MTNTPLTSFRQQTLEDFDEKFGSFHSLKLEGKELLPINDENIKAFLSSALTQQLFLVEEEVGKMREEKPHVLSPDSPEYMYSLAQFNRVAGVNNTVDDILSRIKSGNEEQK